MLDMMEYAAPYKIEGFDNPAMQSVFTNLLTVTPISYTSGARTSSTGQPGQPGQACPSTATLPLSISDGSTPAQPTSFLISMLVDQKKATKALMDAAKRIGPVTQKVVQMEQANATAFESDLQASIPNIGGSLQGFIFLFFIVSYAALTLVSTIMVNVVTGSTGKAGGTFAVFILIGIISMSLIARLG